MKLKKLINLITSFLPWISFTTLSVVYPPLAIPAGLVFSLLTYPKLKQGFILDWASFLFFVILFIDNQIFKDEWLVDHIGSFISLYFVAIAAISILIRRPFTMQYAKLEVKKETWNSPSFYRCNVIMTGGFGFIFLMMAIANFIRTYYYPGWNQWLIWGIAATAQIIFIAQFPKWYRKRYIH
jgi:hypothetical protein